MTVPPMAQRRMRSNGAPHTRWHTADWTVWMGSYGHSYYAINRQLYPSPLPCAVREDVGPLPLGQKTEKPPNHPACALSASS